MSTAELATAPGAAEAPAATPSDAPAAAPARRRAPRRPRTRPAPDAMAALVASVAAGADALGARIAARTEADTGLKAAAAAALDPVVRVLASGKFDEYARPLALLVAIIKGDAGLPARVEEARRVPDGTAVKLRLGHAVVPVESAQGYAAGKPYLVVWEALDGDAARGAGADGGSPTHYMVQRASCLRPATAAEAADLVRGLAAAAPGKLVAALAAGGLV